MRIQGPRISFLLFLNSLCRNSLPLGHMFTKSSTPLLLQCINAAQDLLSYNSPWQVSIINMCHVWTLPDTNECVIGCHPGSPRNSNDHVSVCHVLPSQGLVRVKSNSPSEMCSKKNMLNVKDAKKKKKRNFLNMVIKSFLILCYFPFIEDSLLCATVIDLISTQ